MNKKFILSFVLLISVIFYLVFPCFASNSTIEIYLSSSQELSSSSPDTLSIDDEGIVLVLGDGSKEIILSNLALTSRFPNKNDIYLTLRFSKDTLCFYNHGENIGSIKVSGKNLKIRDFIFDLVDKYKNGQISYLKKTNQALSDKRIKNSYKTKYDSVKLTENRVNKPESHLSQFMILTSGLVLHYDASNLNNGGTAATSSIATNLWTDLTSANGNNGTLTNFTLPTAGSASGWDGSNSIPAPSVLKFDGMDDYVDVGSSSTFKFALANSFTVEVWVRDNSNTFTSIILGNGIDNVSPGYNLKIASGKARFTVSESSTKYKYSETSSLSNGVWYHVVGTWDGTNVKTYLNGVLDSTVTTLGTIATITSTENLNIGNVSNQTGQYLTAFVARTRMYNTALSESQVRQNFLSEAYKFQLADSIVPGVKSDEDLVGVTYKKATDTFDVYVSDTNPTVYGDNDVASITSVSCTLGSVTLTTPTPTELNFTGGLTLDGSDDYIQIGNQLNQTTNDFTIEALIRTSNSATENIICKRNPTGVTNVGYQLFKNAAGYLGAIICDGSGTRIEVDGASYPIANGKWHHVAAVFNRKGNLSLYVDGMADGSESISSQQSSVSNSVDLRIGQNSNGAEKFTGQISNVRMYNRALSSNEVSRNSRYRYEPADFHNIISWWKLDDSTSNPGTTTASARRWDTSTNTVIADTSLNGTLTGFNFDNNSGWVFLKQHSYNINRYVYTVPSFSSSSLNQVEKFQCSVTDKASNTISTEESAGIFISKAPTVFTSIANNGTLKLADNLNVTVLDTTPATSILLNPTTPTATVDTNVFSPTCSIAVSNLTKAISLDGVNDYVSVGNIGSGIRTISFWIKPTNVTSSFLELNTNTNVTSSAGTILASGITNPVIYVNASSSSTISANTWQHVVVVSDVDISASGFNIGLVGSMYYAGQIDDVQVYARELSSNEISRIFSNPGRIINGYKLINWIKFERLDDTDGNNTQDNVRDFSGSGKHGVLTNFGSSLSSALVDSTIANSLDGTIGNCNISITSGNPPGPLNSSSKTLTIQATNALTQSTSETKTVSLLRDQKPDIPSVNTVTIGGTASGTTGTYTVGVGQTFSVSFKASDPDVPNTVTLSTPIAPAVGTFVAGAASNPGVATFTYTPSLQDTGMSYSFTVLATDNIGSTSSSPLTVSFVVGTNVAPSKPSITSASIDGKNADTTGNYNLNPGQAISINVSSTDSDPSGAVSLALVNPPGIGNFAPSSPANTGTGTFTYQANAGHAGMTYTFNIRATDNLGSTSPGDLTISITVKGEVTSTSTSSGSSGTSTSGSPSQPVVVPLTPIDINSLPVLNDIEFIKIPSDYIDNLPTEQNIILAGSENAFLLPSGSSLVEELVNANLTGLSVKVRIVDQSGKESEVAGIASFTLLNEKPIIIQTKQIPSSVADGLGTLAVLINGQAKAKINISIIHPPFQITNARLANLTLPVISLVQVSKKTKNITIKIVGKNFYDKRIFIDGKSVKTTKTQTSLSILPSSGLELLKLKILTKNKLGGVNTISAVYKVTSLNTPQNSTISVINPYGQALKTVNFK